MPDDRTSLDALRRNSTNLGVDERRGERQPLVRFTVDLPENDHHAFKMFALNGRVTMSDAIRALVLILREDEELAAKVIRRARRL